MDADDSARVLITMWNPEIFKLTEACFSRNFLLVKGRGEWSRIDEFMLLLEWMDMFNLKQWELPRLLFDHDPLLVMKDGEIGAKTIQIL